MTGNAARCSAGTDQDVAFWLDVVDDAPTGAGVLELACGTGRVTLPLAAAGVEVTGLDIDPAALVTGPPCAGAPSAWPLLVAADMRQLRAALSLRRGHRSLQQLPTADRPAAVAACLGAVADHLAPGGIFGLEVTDFQAGRPPRPRCPSRSSPPAPFDGDSAHPVGFAQPRPGSGGSAGTVAGLSPAMGGRSTRSPSGPTGATSSRAALEAAGFTAQRWWTDRTVTRVTAQDRLKRRGLLDRPGGPGGQQEAESSPGPRCSDAVTSCCWTWVP